MSRSRLIETRKFHRCRDRDLSRLRNITVVETETDRDWAKDVETETLSRVSLISDTQQHLISCNTILQNLTDCQTIIAVNTIKYEDIYGDVYEQKAIVSLVMECLKIRNQIIENSNQPTSGHCMSLDPSTSLCCANTCSVCIGTM